MLEAVVVFELAEGDLEESFLGVFGSGFSICVNFYSLRIRHVITGCKRFACARSSVKKYDKPFPFNAPFVSSIRREDV